jgi:hypothetical protein
MVAFVSTSPVIDSITTICELLQTIAYPAHHIRIFRSIAPRFHTSQAVEAYGIFKLGEILGRRNLVGYKLKE